MVSRAGDAWEKARMGLREVRHLEARPSGFEVVWKWLKETLPEW
jgi:hypothetical protein